jgi:enoyl-CoA hydratase
MKEAKPEKPILVERRGNTAVLTFNRPDVRNAMSAELYASCIGELAEADRDPDVRCVILTGAGTCFSAGRDLKERNRVRPSAYEYLEHTLFSDEGPAHFYSYLTQYRKPLITAINGPAVAGGCIVAALGDISVASDRAFFALPEIDRGIPPPGGVMVFPNLISRCKATYLLFTGKRIDAMEAERIGLITKVVPDERLREEVFEIADVICQKSPLAMRLLKTSMLASGWSDDIRSNIAREAVRAIGDTTPDRIALIEAYATHAHVTPRVGGSGKRTRATAKRKGGRTP